MKDCFGVDIQEGDKVVYIPRYYKSLKVGEVVGFTPRCVRIADLHDDKDVVLRDRFYVFKYNGDSNEIQ